MYEEQISEYMVAASCPVTKHQRNELKEGRIRLGSWFQGLQLVTWFCYLCTYNAAQYCGREHVME